MKALALSVGALLLAAAASKDTAPLLDASKAVPGLLQDFRYATPNNFLGKKVYPDGARCLLLPDTVDRLTRVSKALKKQGYRIRAYDCFRPRSVQFQMWEILPKPGYVANPYKGSNHNRGAAIDLTLAELDGGWVEMPTDFDTFSEAAHQGYDGGTVVSRVHREILLTAMTAEGFEPNRMEWWHFDLPDAGTYAVLEVPLVPGGSVDGGR